MKTISGMLLKAGVGEIPTEVMIDGLESIQRLVGGNIDSVTIDAQQVDSDNDMFTLVGYCHDEALILNLDMNWLASALFERELHGDVVVVSGTSKGGDYDGENYDIPNDMVQWLRTTFVVRVADTYNMASQLTQAFKFAVDNKLIDMSLVDEMMVELMDDVNNGSQSEMVASKLHNLIDVTAEAIAGHIEKEMGVDDLVNEIEQFLKTETEK